jgi:hypothetical protein
MQCFYVFSMSVEINRDQSRIQHLHILRRNCLLKHVIERKIKGNVEGTWRRGWRREQLQDDLKEEMGCRRGCGPVVRQKTVFDLCSRNTLFSVKYELNLYTWFRFVLVFGGSIMLPYLPVRQSSAVAIDWPFKWQVISHLPSAGIIRSSPYTPR